MIKLIEDSPVKNPPLRLNSPNGGGWSNANKQGKAFAHYLASARAGFGSRMGRVNTHKDGRKQDFLQTIVHNLTRKQLLDYLYLKKGKTIVSNLTHVFYIFYIYGMCCDIDPGIEGHLEKNEKKDLCVALTSWEAVEGFLKLEEASVASSKFALGSARVTKVMGQEMYVTAPPLWIVQLGTTPQRKTKHVLLISHYIYLAVRQFDETPRIEFGDSITDEQRDKLRKSLLGLPKKFKDKGRKVNNQLCDVFNAALTKC